MSIEIEAEKMVFAIYINSDLTEGRGYNYPLFICEKRSTAVRMAFKRNVQGCNGQVEEVPAFRLKNHYGWFAPAVITGPSKEDLDNEKKMEAEQKLAEAKAIAIEKARLLGLSDSDIEALRGL